MMGRLQRPVQALIWLHALALAGCAQVGPSEISAAACVDGDDNDGDSFEDCDDPDCWSYARCLKRGGAAAPLEGAAGAAGTNGSPDAGMPDAGGLPAVPVDSGTPVTPPEPPAGDAGEVVDCSTCSGSPACATSCPLGTPQDLGVWRITTLEVSAPLFAGPECVDRDCGIAAEYIPFIPPVCPCLPDPQVAIAVDGMQVGTTAPKLERQEAIWSSPGFELPLRDGSRITFSVYDNDVAGTPLLMYACSTNVSAAELEDGQVTCEGPNVLNVQYGISASLVLP